MGISVLTDSALTGFAPNFLDLLTVIALFFGVTVIVAKNPVVSLISLIGLFGTIAVYLILIGLNFIGFSYLIVYIGAVSILFLFIIMLINVSSSDLFSNNFNSVPLAILIIILLHYSWTILSSEYNGVIQSQEENYFYIGIIQSIVNFYEYMIRVMMIISITWEGFLIETSHIVTVGMILYTVYNIWLFISSLILVLAMVGSIVITSPNRNT